MLRRKFNPLYPSADRRVPRSLSAADAIAREVAAGRPAAVPDPCAVRTWIVVPASTPLDWLSRSTVVTDPAGLRRSLDAQCVALPLYPDQIAAMPDTIKLCARYTPEEWDALIESDPNWYRPFAEDP